MSGRRAPDRDIIRITLLATAVIVLSIVLAGSASYTLTRRAVLEKLTSQDLVTVAELITGRIDLRIEQAKEVSLMLARDPQVIAWVAAGEPEGRDREMARQRLQTLVSAFDYTNAYIVSAVTRNYWDETGDVLDVLNPDDPDDTWFFRLVRSGTPIDVVYDYNADRQDTFVFINALIGDVERPLGIAGVGLGLGELAEYMRSVRPGEAVALWVIAENGTIYLSDDPGSSGRSVDAVLGEAAGRRILQALQAAPGRHHTFAVQGPGGELVDLIAYPLRSTDWILLVETPRRASIGFLGVIRVQQLLAALVVLVVMTVSFHVTSRRLVDPYKRARELNEELERQVRERTAELQEKNAALTDSIEYARRIQRSVLPQEELLEQVFRDHMLVWLPRDAVGGDFYWVKRLENGGLVIAVGDCTGHGVPGALMSMISISLLDQMVGDDRHDPAAVLGELNRRIKRMLQQESAGRSLTDDGLDIGICHWDGARRLTYAGARMTLYVRDGAGLKSVPGDRTSVGYTRTRSDFAFTNHVLALSGGERFYLTTDGFIDQFGEATGASFGRTRFAATIESLAALPLSAQKDSFIRVLKEYAGDTPQLDDVTLLAFALNETTDGR